MSSKALSASLWPSVICTFSSITNRAENSCHELRFQLTEIGARFLFAVIHFRQIERMRLFDLVFRDREVSPVQAPVRAYAPELRMSV